MWTGEKLSTDEKDDVWASDFEWTLDEKVLALDFHLGVRERR